MNRSGLIRIALIAAAQALVWFAPAAQPKYPQIDPLPSEMKPYTESIPGTDIKFDMVPIPGGVYLMGSPPGEPGRAEDEGPQHLVRIRPFWMGKTEVTWDEYDVFAFGYGLKKTAGPKADAEKLADAVTRPTPPYADETFGLGRHGQPVICITHHAAMEYSRWLSELTGKIYRLPTEAEWEYACRAGTTTAYSFDDDPAKLGDYAWPSGPDAKLHPVAKKKPNPWGLYDMHGNVAEWCLDLYDKDYYKSFDPGAPAVAPVLLPTSAQYPYVTRGGGWRDRASLMRCAARRASTDDWSVEDPQRPQSIWWHTEAVFIGFRIARPLEEQENLKGLKSKVKKYDF